MQKVKNNAILVFSILYILATVSAKYSYMMEAYLSNLFKYGLAFLILIMTFITANRTEIERRKLGRSIQTEWMWLFAYAILFVTQHQFLVSGSRLAFGISMGVANGIQKLAALFIGCYVLKKGDKTFCRAIVITFLVIIVVDSFNTLQAVEIDDQALRQATMGDDGMITEEVEEMGVGNVNNIFSYINCLPILFFILANQKSKLFKLLIVGIILILAYSVLNAGFTMAMTIMLISLAIMTIDKVTDKPAVKIILGIALVVIVFGIDWSRIVLEAAKNSVNASVKERLLDVYNFLESGAQGDAMASRTDGYTRGLTGFLKSPLIGNIMFGKRIISGHSTIIDIMSDWGIIGISIYFGYLLNMFRASVYYVKREYNIYIIIAFILFIISFVINPIGDYVHSIAIISIFFPAASKLVYLNNEATEEFIEEKTEVNTIKSCVR